MPRISQLTSLTVPEANDEIAIVDVSSATTKKITRADLLKGADLPNDTVTTDSIADGAVTPAKVGSVAWTSWTPTFTNFNLGNGSVSARYAKFGSILIFRVRITLGSTSSVTGRIALSLPVAAASGYGSGTDAFVDAVVMLRDTSASVSVGSAAAIFESTTSIGIGALLYASATNVLNFTSTSSSTPFTWANGDIISVQGSYEVAV